MGPPGWNPAAPVTQTAPQVGGGLWDAILGIGGDLLGGFFGQKATEHANEMSLENLLMLGQQQDLLNNANIYGIFGGYENTIGPDGRRTIQQVVNSDIDPAVQGLIGRVNQGSADPRLEQLQAAMFSQMMNRGPTAAPPRRENPLNKAKMEDEEGNSITPYWWMQNRDSYGV